MIPIFQTTYIDIDDLSEKKGKLKNLDFCVNVIFLGWCYYK